MSIFQSGLYGYLLLALLLGISAVVSILYYRKSELSKFKKAVLVLLRAASLFLIIALLLNPLINFTRVSGKTGVDIILIDNSSSLTIENRFGGLRNAADRVREFSSNHKTFAFASVLLGEINDENYFSGSPVRTYSSSLASALEEIYSMPKDYSINSVTVISDGILEKSGSLIPTAKKSGAPFYYLIVGDTIQKSDLVISKVFFNRNSFAGSTSTVKVLVNSYGYKEIIRVRLFEENILKETKEVLTNNSSTEYFTEFKVSSPSTGIRKYSVRVDTAGGEITTLNNSRDFFIKYIDNKFTALAVAGSPGADLSALKQALSKTENFKTDFFVQKSLDSFYEGVLPPLNAYDAVILSGFPLAGTDNKITTQLSTEIEKKGIPVIFLNASNTGYEDLKQFEKFLPFSMVGSKDLPYLSTVRVPNYDFPEQPESVRKINLLPAAFYSKSTFNPKPGAETLGFTTAGNEPAILFHNDGKTKSAAYLGYGFYKWSLNAGLNTGNMLQNLVSVLFNLVLNENKFNKFTLRADKDYYAVSEPVEIKAFTGNTDASISTVRLKITGKNSSDVMDMQKIDEGVYSSVFTPSYESDFTAEGVLFVNNQAAANDAIRFISGIPVEEYIVTKPSDDVLKTLSASTGGVDLKKFDRDKFESLNKDRMTDSYTGKMLFRDSVILLLSIIILLSLEWFLRKRFNLP